MIIRNELVKLKNKVNMMALMKTIEQSYAKKMKQKLEISSPKMITGG
jgi:hypothetical protein